MNVQAPSNSYEMIDFIKLRYKILPLPKIRMVVDSGFKITAISFFLQTIGFSKVNFNGVMEENFAALICNPIFTRQP